MADLIPSIAAHALGGVILACGIWAVGLGCLPRLQDRRAPLGYAVGLLVVTAAAVLVLLTPWLAIVALPLVAAPLVRLLRARPAWLAEGGRLLAWTLPSAVGLGFALAWLVHPPTAEHDSNAYGDFVYYAVKLDWARDSLVPLRDFTVEGANSNYVEGAPTFVGAALSHLPGFDPFLFGAATLPAFLVAALAIGFGLTRARAASPLLALLGVACVAYPTWLTESAPVALAVPLAFALYALWREGATRAGWIVLFAAAALDFALTKGFGGIVLVVLAAFGLVRQHGLRVRPALPYVGLAAVAGATGTAVFLVTSSWLAHRLGGKFLPADAVRGLNDERTVRNTQDLTPTLLIVGESLLFAALVRARAWTFAAVLAAGIAGTWFVGGHGFDITIGLAVLLAVLYLREAPDALRGQRILVLVAAAALALSAWFRDISGVRTTAFFVALLGLGLLAALTPRLRAAASGAAVVVAVLAPIGLVRGQTTLYAEDYAVWHRVHETVPSDGLVFTSLTGPAITGYQGWNYYPGVALRQVYLAGWSNSSLLVRRNELLRRLDRNRRVLNGELAPARAQLSRRYSQFFAVTRRDDAPPPSFRQLYANDRYALYRIES
jgi:hypothetical protein